MKNLHVLPTEKTSRLLKTIPKGNLLLAKKDTCGSNYQNQNIYITNDEKIKEGDWILYTNPNTNRTFVVKCTEVTDTYFDFERLTLEIRQIPIMWAKKIILTTNTDLIYDKIQAIDDEFLEWFVKNPSYDSVEVVPLRKSSGYYDEKEVWYWDFLAYKIIIPKVETKYVVLGYKTSTTAQTLDINSNFNSKKETI